MRKISIKLILSLAAVFTLIFISTATFARIGAGGGVGVGGYGAVGVGGGRADFRGVDNVGYRGYDQVDVDRNVYDVNRANVYNAPGDYARGRYYWNGAYYNYYYNGVYYNNCELVPGHWANGQWYAATEHCW